MTKEDKKTLKEALKAKVQAINCLRRKYIRVLSVKMKLRKTSAMQCVQNFKFQDKIVQDFFSDGLNVKNILSESKWQNINDKLQTL